MFSEGRILGKGPGAFYGRSKYTATCQDYLATRGEDFYYIDNGYFNPGHYDGHYRVTKNAAQHDGTGNAPYDKFARLHVPIEPWRKTGRHILVICQSKTYFELRGMSAGTWLWETNAELARYTDRPILVRPKPTRHTKSRPLEEDLEDCWAVVTQSSNVAVEAILKGIPAVVTGQCAATLMSTELTHIETPNYPERAQWAWNLAANQWTLDEMRAGICWHELHV